MNHAESVKISDAIISKAYDKESCAEVMAMLTMTLAKLKKKFDMEDEKILVGIMMGLKLGDITNFDTKESDSILEIIKES